MDKIKYEPVFGVHEFKNDWCDIVIKTPMGGMFEAKFVNGMILPEHNFIYAMRRIIKQPQWTWEDKKSGRLPEVGAKIQHVISKKPVDVLLYKNDVVVLCAPYVNCAPFNIEKSSLLSTYEPIETPEEKAQRLREEFVEKVKEGMRYANSDAEHSFDCGVRMAYDEMQRRNKELSN